MIEIGESHPRPKRIKDKWYERYVRDLEKVGFVELVGSGITFYSFKLTDAGIAVLLTATWNKYTRGDLDGVKRKLSKIVT